jgi:hypothetical protein
MRCTLRPRASSRDSGDPDLGGCGIPRLGEGAIVERTDVSEFEPNGEPDSRVTR